MTENEIRGLADALHDAAVTKGFWCVDNAKDKHVAKWRGELGEVIQADRMDMMYEVERDGAKPEGVAAELADFVMMALDLFAAACLPLEEILDGVVFSRKLNNEMALCALEVLVNSLYSASCDIVEQETDYERAVAFCIRGPEIWLKARGYDLWELIREKMAYNESRPMLHGRAY